MLKVNTEAVGVRRDRPVCITLNMLTVYTISAKRAGSHAVVRYWQKKSVTF